MTLALLLLPLFSGLNASEPCEEVYDPYCYTKDDGLDVYHFPITPGTEKWKEARRRHRNGDGPEPEALLSIPDSILTTMSTYGLAATCFKYPGRQPWGTSNLGRMTFEMLAEMFFNRFNGSVELREREDLVSALCRIYISGENYLLQDCQFLDSPLSRTLYLQEMAMLEIVLSRDWVVSRMKRDEIDRVLSLALERDAERRGQPWGTETSMVLWGTILLSNKDGEFSRLVDSNAELREFLQKPILSTSGAQELGFAEEMATFANQRYEILQQGGRQ